MSVLIKGMEMPRNCMECEIKAWDGDLDVCPFSRVPCLSIGRQDDCPLVELPEKRIPKNLNKIPVKENENLWTLHCPSCKNWIGIWNSMLKRGDMCNNSNRNVCPYCGQAIIDLEDNKE